MTDENKENSHRDKELTKSQKKLTNSEERPHERQCQAQHTTPCWCNAPFSFMVHLALCPFCRARTLPRARKWFSAAITVISKTRRLYGAIRGPVERPTDAFWCRITANIPSPRPAHLFATLRWISPEQRSSTMCYLLPSKHFQLFVEISFRVTFDEKIHATPREYKWNSLSIDPTKYHKSKGISLRLRSFHSRSVSTQVPFSRPLIFRQFHLLPRLILITKFPVIKFY